MRRILPLLFAFLLVCSQSIAQPTAVLSFLNGADVGGDFCVDIYMTFDVANRLGSSNLYFTYDQSNLSNPVISNHQLTNKYAAPTLTVPGTDVAAFNVVLQSDDEGIPIQTTETKIATICFDVADITQVITLNWITSGRFESIIFLDNESQLANLAPDNQMVNWNGSIFPVEWLDFNAIQEGADAVLNWSTAQEINNNKFEIERSVDGQSFEIIGSTPGQGNSSSVNSYVYIDKGAANLKIRKLYYRLRQVDFDGTFDYSPTVELGIEGEDFLSIFGYPSPISEELNVRYSSLLVQELHLEVLNSLGQVVHYQKTNDIEGEYSLDTSKWPVGVYYLSIRGNVHQEVYKIFKEN